MRLIFALFGTVGLITANFAFSKTIHSFEKLWLDSVYWSKGACFADMNMDGVSDAVSGPYWWEGPELITRHEIYDDKQTFVAEMPDGSKKTYPGFHGVFGNKNAYSTDNFFSFAYDFNGDGWNDLLTFGLPHTPGYLYLNPKSKDKHWDRYTVFDQVDNESPTFADLTGDGKPELICNYQGNFGYASPDWNNPTKPWKFIAISENGEWPQYTHGMGIGDVDGDGHTDVLYNKGWWENPDSGKPGKTWDHHIVPFAPHGGKTDGGAQMYVYDVNGDGLNDVISAIAAHGWGLAWYEQLKEKGPKGEPTFKMHLFMNKKTTDNRYGIAFSQLHAVELVDIDGDGLKDIVTGKCLWAHGPHKGEGANDKADLYWFRLLRQNDGSVDWVPHLIDDDSGVGRQIGIGDVNTDGLPDIIIGNKKGTLVFVHQVTEVSNKDWKSAQPKVKYPDAGTRKFAAEDFIYRSTPR